MGFSPTSEVEGSFVRGTKLPSDLSPKTRHLRPLRRWLSLIWSLTAAASSNIAFHALCTNWLTYLLKVTAL